MKTMTAALVLLLLAFPAFGALQYDFHQKNTSDDSITPVTDLRARATIDGDRSRIDFLAGNLYPPGTYVVSTDGSRNLRFVDPKDQSFTEVNTASVITALSTANIKITNQKIDVVELPDPTTIAGIPTKGYKVTMNYDISRVVRGIPLKQHVQTIIEAWTTTQYANTRRTFLGGAPRTGNPELDTLLEAETSRIPGFPMRQVVTIRTNYERPRGSRLETPTARTLTREMWVTSVRETTPGPGDFIVPVTFHRADQPDVPRWSPQVLTFEPASK